MLATTLLAEGTSDRALIPILKWVLVQHWPSGFSDPLLADLSWLRDPPRSLAHRATEAVRWYPCDLLFVHRDADREEPLERVREMERALASAALSHPPAVCLVPLRATETWLLIDETAIRSAAGRPNGQRDLGLPRLDRLEGVAAPKRLLHEALRTASERSGRRLTSFRVESAVHRVAELIDDFSPLRTLTAFRAFEERLRDKLAAL